MVENKKKIKSIGNTLWIIILSIIKSIIVLLIIGVIMYFLSLWGSGKIYTKNSSNRSYNGWAYHENLNPIYGVLGIIIYIAINHFSFLLYNYIINQFKNYKTIIGKIMYILFSIFINGVMLIIYFRLFGSYSFENILLNFLNDIIVRFGYITFPIVFGIIYIYRRKLDKK